MPSPTGVLFRLTTNQPNQYMMLAVNKATSSSGVLPAAPDSQQIAVSPQESEITIAVPLQELKHIWKAVNLLSSDTSIVACPGHQSGFAVASACDPMKH